jgi:uncharacterized protein
MWLRLAFWLLLLSVLVLMLRRFEHNQVYHPGRDFEITGAELGRPFENVFFKATDGVELNAWFFPADTNSPRAQLALLISHGNAGNISSRTDVYQVLLEAGLSVFAYDYRGYGRSQGTPGESGTYLDAQAAYQWLRQKGFAARNILSYGESLGGGVASELCLREETGGLILQSTFTSIPDIGAELFPWLPVRWMARIKYDTHRKLPQLRIPVLVMHSRDDKLIGFHHAEKNFAAANGPKVFCELQGEHNDPLGERKRFARGIEQFLALIESSPRPATAALEH